MSALQQHPETPVNITHRFMHRQQACTPMKTQVIKMTHYLTNKKSHDKNSPGQ